MVVELFRYGVLIGLVWCWCCRVMVLYGFDLVLEWFWYGFDMVLIQYWHNVVLILLWYGVGIVLVLSWRCAGIVLVRFTILVAWFWYSVGMLWAWKTVLVWFLCCIFLCYTRCQNYSRPTPLL